MTAETVPPYATWDNQMSIASRSGWTSVRGEPGVARWQTPDGELYDLVHIEGDWFGWRQVP